MGTTREQAKNRIAEEDLRAVTGPAELTRLWVKLGFDEAGLDVPPEAWSAWGIRESDALALGRLSIVAARGAFRVLLFELLTPAGQQLVTSVMAGRARRDPAARELAVFASPGYEELTFCVRVLGQEALRTRRLVVRRRHPHASDVEAVSELCAPDASEPATEMAFRFEEALDRERVTDRFFRAFRATLDTFKSELRGFNGRPATRDDVAGRFCLLVLNRLLFLYFIQKKGWLNGDRAFLPGLLRRARAEGRPFYELLKTLFFGALNTPRAERSQEALALGRFPYLNGGLFEPDALERANPGLTIADAAFDAAFEKLLEKFRFTVREDPESEQDVGVDPEMLGKVFENLMDAEERGDSGSFYTPREAVARMVRQALGHHLERRAGLTAREAERLLEAGDAAGLPQERVREALESLEEIRVLDPAAGSGAFLLGMLGELTRAQQTLRRAAGAEPVADWRIRRRIIHRSLYGVDIKGNAVKLCALRLWLALAVDLVEDDVALIPPLPNLDHKVKQGDSLLSPLDLVDASSAAAFHAKLRSGMAKLAKLKDTYESASGSVKREVAATLAARERQIALELLDFRLRVLGERLEGPEATARGRDLFGRRLRLDAATRGALGNGRAQVRQLEQVRKRLLRGGELPAFSAEVHFAEAMAAGGFDIVVGNPPWVRLSRIPESSRRALRARYPAFREGCWRRGAEASGGGAGGGGQVDLSALFLERSMELVRSGGIVSLMLPSKLFSTLYGGGIRKRLGAGWSLLALEDHSGSRRKLFQADTFPAVLTARKEAPAEEHEVSVRVETGSGETRRFRLPQARLAMLEGDDGAPWLAAPAQVRDALDRMRLARATLGQSLAPSMGYKTGFNRVFVVERCEPEGDALRIYSRGFRDPVPGRRPSDYTATVEPHSVRPLIRGDSLAEWNPQARTAILWRTGSTGAPLLERYLRRHRASLGDRGSAAGASPRGSRCDEGPFIVWKDIARHMAAAYVEGPIAGPAGEGWPVPLNSTNYISVPDPERGHALTALLNSTPARALLASHAPRAKDGFLRFPCWTAGLLPLPELAPGGPLTRALAELSRRLHETRGEDAAAAGRLDQLAARAFGLSSAQLAVLADWLRFLEGRKGD